MFRKALVTAACLAAFPAQQLFAALPTPAAPIDITYGGTTYTLSSSWLNYTTGSATLEAQPYWGDAALANALANLTQYQLGTLNDGTDTSATSGPGALFAYGTSGGAVSIAYWEGGALIDCPYSCPGLSGYYLYAIVLAMSAGYTLEEALPSLISSNQSIDSFIASSNLAIHGAHSRPLFRFVPEGQKTAWVAGDFGRDDHNDKSGDTSLAEFGFGYNYGSFQLNASLGKTWSGQNLINNGETDTSGEYLYLESLIPLKEDLVGTVGLFVHQSDVDTDRGYLVGLTEEHSKGDTDVTTLGLRARLDWLNAVNLKSMQLSPYADFWYSKTTVDAFTETGGSFAASYDKQTNEAVDLHVGVNGIAPISDTDVDFVVNLEVASTSNASSSAAGEIQGVGQFDFNGEDYSKSWVKAGLGVEGLLGEGKYSVMLNGTSESKMASAWLAATYQVSF